MGKDTEQSSEVCILKGIKVPATEEGIPAIQELISAGISVNVTLLFGVDMYERVAEA